MVLNENFLWGAAGSAFQTEGAYNKDGKSLTSMDVRSFKSKKKIADTKIAVDHYHRYKEDIKLMKELGLTAYRLSISWSRIIPSGDGEVNNKGIEFYSNLIDELILNNITPVVTLFHFDFPMPLIDKMGGFQSRRCIEAFVRYCETCFEQFGDRVKYWLTINEQTAITSNPSMQGIDIEDEFEREKVGWQTYHHLCLAHALVIKKFRMLNLKGQIGPVLSYPTYYAASVRPEDVLLAKQIEDYRVFALMDVHYYGEHPRYLINYLSSKDMMFEMEDKDKELLADAKPDFIGINWYTTGIVGTYKDGINVNDEETALMPRRDRNIEGVAQFYLNPYVKYNEWNWNIDPIGLRYALLKMWERYHLPIMIVENGLGHRDTVEDGQIHDYYRIEYLDGMVKSIVQAVDDGVNILGYCPWSFLDVVSTSEGIEKRYGLVYVDRTDSEIKELKRIPKDSYYWYQECIKKNGSI